MRCKRCYRLLRREEEKMIEICDNCYKIKHMTQEEVEILNKVLDLFEHQTLIETGYHRISGGFASAYMIFYDDEYIDIELKFGVQSDCSNNVTVEQYKLERDLLTSEKDIEAIVLQID